MGKGEKKRNRERKRRKKRKILERLLKRLHRDAIEKKKKGTTSHEAYKYRTKS